MDSNEARDSVDQPEVIPGGEKLEQLIELAGDIERQPKSTAAGDRPPVSERYDYADGSYRIGVAPFPAKSPIEETADALRAATPPQDTVARALAAEEERKQREIEAARIAAEAERNRANTVTANTLENAPQPDGSGVGSGGTSD